MTHHDDTAHPFPRVFSGEFLYRMNGGDVHSELVHLEISQDRVLVRYGDGVDHVGRRGDDVVDFFLSGPAPSLTPAAARPSVDLGESPASP